METADRPLRIEWFMLHSGYIRYFGQTIGLLAERGHSVHLAFTRIEKDAGDARLAHALADDPSERHLRAGAATSPRRRLAAARRVSCGASSTSAATSTRAMRTRPRCARGWPASCPSTSRTARAIDPVTSPGDAAPDPIHGVADERAALAAHRRRSRGGRAGDPHGRGHRRLPARSAVPTPSLVTPVIEFASTQVEYVKSARRAGIPSGVGDRELGQPDRQGARSACVPDRVFVWNDVQVSEAAELHGVPRERVVATGAPKFDEWFERRRARTREELAERAGLDPGRPYVLYVCSSPFIAPRRGRVRPRAGSTRLRADERPALRDARRARPAAPAERRASGDGADLSDVRNVAVWPRAGAQPDAGDARAEFFDSLAHSAAVVGINTSALLEAAILGKSVLVAARAASSPGRRRGRCTSATCCTRTAASCTSPRRSTSTSTSSPTALERGDDQAEQTRRFVESFLRPRGLDRPAAPILADASSSSWRSSGRSRRTRRSARWLFAPR